MDYSGPQVSRQNFFSHGKTCFLTAKIFTITFHNFIDRNGRLINMGADDDTVDDLIRKYLFKGFRYREICLFLERNHEGVVSITTLKRRAKQLGLRRRLPCYDIDATMRAITQVLDGPNSNLGYRSVWPHLQMKGTRVPRNIVATLLKELDP